MMKYPTLMGVELSHIDGINVVVGPTLLGWLLIVGPTLLVYFLAMLDH